MRREGGPSLCLNWSDAFIDAFFPAGYKTMFNLLQVSQEVSPGLPPLSILNALALSLSHLLIFGFCPAPSDWLSGEYQHLLCSPSTHLHSGEHVGSRLRSASPGLIPDLLCCHFHVFALYSGPGTPSNPTCF